MKCENCINHGICCRWEDKKRGGCTKESCEDTISREAAIDCLEQLVTDIPQLKLYAQKVADAIGNLSPVEPQEPKWIPVLERSPEKSGKYLAYIINKKDNKLQYIMTCEYLVDGYWHWFPDDECASDNVIAWMPLPEPYKSQESEVLNGREDEEA